LADNLALLFELKADNSQAKSTLKDTQSAVAGLRSSFGSDMAVMEKVGTQALKSVNSEVVNLIRQIPIIGTVLAPVTQSMLTQAAASTAMGTANEGAAVATTELAGAEVAADAAGAPLLATIGAIAIAAGGMALVLGGIALAAFKMAESASEAGSKIHDLSQQTGLSALTLSGVKLAADEASKSIDTVVPAMGRLNKIALSAVEGNKQAEASLKQFGLTGKQVQQDTDAAFGKIISRLHELVPTGEAAGAATKLFGRAGAELIPIVEQMNGDLDGAIQKAKDLGQAFDTEGARAADEFGDHLADLKKSVEGLTFAIGNQLIPAFNGLFRVFEAESKGGGVIGYALKVINYEVTNLINKLYIALAAAESLFGKGTFKENLERILKEAYTPEPEKAKAGVPLEKPDSTKDTKSKALDDRIAGIKDGEKQIQTAYEAARDKEKQIFEQRQESLQDFANAQIRVENDRKAQMLAAVYTEEAAILNSGVAESEQLKKLKDVYAERAKITQEAEHNIAAIKKDAADKAEAAKIAHDEAMLTLHEEEGAALIAKDKGLAETGQITYEQAEKNKQATLAAGLANRIEFLKQEQAKWGENTLEYKKFADQLAVLRQKDVADAASRNEKLAAESQRDLDREAAYQAKYGKLIQDGLALEEEIANLRLDLLRIAHGTGLQIITAQLNLEQAQEDKRHRAEMTRIAEERKAAEAAVKGTQDEAKKKLEIQQTYDALIEKEKKRHDLAMGVSTAANKAALKALNPFSEAMDLVTQKFGEGTFKADLFTGALQGIESAASGVAQGVGDAVKAFVLFGSTGGSFRKFAAEIIASVAQMATVQAVFELAQGLAMEALFWFTGNPKYQQSATVHFVSAAAFGAIAGVAAVAGRAVAGNSFKDQGAAGSGSGGGGTGSASVAPGAGTVTTDKTITEPRFGGRGTNLRTTTDQQPQRIILEVRSNDSHIIKVVNTDYKNNGQTRQTFTTDGSGATS
jgi:hypothetical protein